MNLFDLTTYMGWLSTVVGVTLFRKILMTQLRLLIVFQIISSICDLILIYIIPMGDGMYVRLFYCFLRPIEYWVYLTLLLGFDFKSLVGRYAIASFACFVLFACYQLIYRLDQYDLSDQLMLVEGILTITATLLYFRMLLLGRFPGSIEPKSLRPSPEFWVATSLLFFFTGNIITTGFYHRLYEHSPSFIGMLYSYTNLVLGIVQSVMFVIAYLAAASNGKNNNSSICPSTRKLVL